jgi:hypothetical protein
MATAPAAMAQRPEVLNARVKAGSSDKRFGDRDGEGVKWVGWGFQAVREQPIIFKNRFYRGRARSVSSSIRT